MRFERTSGTFNRDSASSKAEATTADENGATTFMSKASCPGRGRLSEDNVPRAHFCRSLADWPPLRQGQPRNSPDHTYDESVDVTARVYDAVCHVSVGPEPGSSPLGAGWRLLGPSTRRLLGGLPALLPGRRRHSLNGTVQPHKRRVSTGQPAALRT